MVYILSVNLKNTKSVIHELAKLYGIGKYQSKKLCNLLNFGTNIYVSDLNQTNLYSLLKQIEQNNILVERELQEFNHQMIAQLVKIKCYKGIRHIFKLPVRGQRTRTNANTRKKSNLISK